MEAQLSPIKKKIFERQNAEKARKQIFESSSEVKLPYKYTFLCDLFRQLVAAVCESVVGDELLVLVDAFDCLDAAYLEPWPGSSLFDWLPPRLPDNGYPVRIIVSCQTGPALSALEEWGAKEGISMPMKEIVPLSDVESSEMVEAKLSLMAFRDGSYIIKQRDEENERAARARARRLKDAEGRSATVEDAEFGDENDTNTIGLSALEKGASLLDDLDTSHRAASNEVARKRSGRLPLYLNYAAKIMWDYIQRQNGDPRTALRVIRLAASLPNSFRELVGNEIQRIEDACDMETGWTRDFACFLTVTRLGLLEIEAWQLLRLTFSALDDAGEPPIQVWRNIRTEFHKFLQTQSDTSDNAMRWAHWQFTDVVQAKYLVHPKVAAGYHRILADYFNSIIQELRLEEIGMSLEKWLDSCIVSDESARALNEIAYHRMCSGAITKTFEILTDLRYLEIRLLLGQLDVLIKDFSSAISFMRSKGKTFEATKLGEYRTFVLQTGWQLLKRPWASFQEAMNLPINKAPSLYANELLQRRMEQRRWVKWINQVVSASDCMRVKRAHQGAVVWFDTSDDGELLITIGQDSKIRVWSLHSGDFIVDIGMQYNAVRACWLPSGQDGHTAVVIDGDGHCKLWSMSIPLQDKTQNAVLDQLFVSKAPLRTMVALPKHRELWISGDDLMIHVISFDLVLLQRVRSLHNSAVKCSAASSCCSVVATGSDDKTIRVWRVTDRSILVVLVGHLGAVTSLCFCGIGMGCLSSSSSDGVLKVWQVDRGVVSSSMKADSSPIVAVAASRIGPQVVTGSQAGSIRMWDPDTFASSQTFVDANTDSSTTSNACRIVFFNEDRQILVGASDGSVQSYSLHAGHRGRIVKCHFYDDKRLITCSEDKSIRLWSATAGNEVGKLIGHAARVTDFDCGVVDNTAVILTGSDDGSMLLWSLISGARLQRWDCSKKGVRCVLMHAGSKSVFAGCGDGCVRAFHCVTGAPLYEARGHTGVIRRLLLALDDRCAVLAHTVN
jgi:WD40 repeat protein